MKLLLPFYRYLQPYLKEFDFDLTLVEDDEEELLAAQSFFYRRQNEVVYRVQCPAEWSLELQRRDHPEYGKILVLNPIPGTGGAVRVRIDPSYSYVSFPGIILASSTPRPQFVRQLLTSVEQRFGLDTTLHIQEAEDEYRYMLVTKERCRIEPTTTYGYCAAFEVQDGVDLVHEFSLPLTVTHLVFI